MKSLHLPKLLAAVTLISVTASCSSVVPRSQTCVDWIDVSDPQTAYDEAEVVITGAPRDTEKVIELFGLDAAVYEIAVTKVLKGSVDSADTVLVASTPATCTGNTVYPEGDPLDVDGERILFLNATDTGEVWRLITPLHTVLPVSEDGSLPFSTSSSGTTTEP